MIRKVEMMERQVALFLNYYNTTKTKHSSFDMLAEASQSQSMLAFQDRLELGVCDSNYHCHHIPLRFHYV